MGETRSRQNSFKRYWELFFRKFWTFFLINLVYFLFCIPIITFGPATTALTAMMRNIYLERPQFVFSDFKDYFKESFKKSFLIGIVDVIMIELAVFLFVFWNLFIGEEYRAVQMALIFALALFLMMNFYIYPQIAALELPMSKILKNSLIMMFLNPGGEFIALALFAGYTALLRAFTIFVAPLMPFVPLAWLAFTAVYCCYPTIQKVLIEPYYEARGEKNPEITEVPGDEQLFKDRSGEESADSGKRIKDESKRSGKKVIK